MLAGFKRSDELALFETHLIGQSRLETNRLVQLAVAIDETNAEMRLYQDGELVQAIDFFDSLSSVNDVNSWLGRSQYLDDATFGGTFYEFRIYGEALTHTELHETYLAGPRAAF